MTGDLARDIRAFVADGSGLDAGVVIPGNDPAPAPTGPYSTVLLIAESRYGVSPTRHVYDAMMLTIHGTTYVNRESTWSVQFFRAGAVEYAQRFRDWTTTPLGVLAAERLHLTMRSANEVRRIDHIVSDTWEERASLDLTIGSVHIVEQDLGVIREVPIEINNTGEIEVSYGD